jgi:hypothetical protein
MYVSKPVAVLLGVATLWPLVYIVIFTTSFFLVMSVEDQTRLDSLFRYLFAAHILTMFLGIALLGFYVTHLFKNDRMPSEQRILWMLVLFMGNVLAFPVYWYLHVWPKRAIAAAV